MMMKYLIVRVTIKILAMTMMMMFMFMTMMMNMMKKGNVQDRECLTLDPYVELLLLKSLPILVQANPGPGLLKPQPYHRDPHDLLQNHPDPHDHPEHPLAEW